MNFIVDTVIYPYKIVFIFDETDEQVERLLKRYNLSTAEFLEKTFKLGRCTKFTNNMIVVRIRKLPKNPEYKSVLSHEVFHVVTFIMDGIGASHSDSSEECYAYLTDYITKKVYERIDKRK